MIVNVKVKPNQPKFSVNKQTDDRWIITTRSPAQDNRANLEIIRELSKKYSSVRILKGSKSSRKVLKVEV